VAAVAQRAGTSRTGQRRALRAQLTTTPVRLVLAAIALAGGALTFGLVAATTANSRRDAADSVATRTEPLVVSAAQMHGALSDADATVSATFVIGGAELRASRQRYLADLNAASQALTVLGKQADVTPATRRAVLEIGRQLPVYAGLIETARANNRQGLPVGAAYLRQASGLMRQQILPAAAQLYGAEGRRLLGGYSQGTSATGFVTLALATVGMLALLVLAQVYLARLTHRTFNLPLVAATLLVVAVAGWALVAFGGEQRALGRAQRDGSDPVEVLSAVRALALRAQADEGLALAARGGGAANIADFDASMRMLGAGQRANGVLDEAQALAERHGSGGDVRRLDGRFADYLRIHQRVVSLSSQGKFRNAGELSAVTGLRIADAVKRDLDTMIATSQRRFASAAADARSAVRGLWLAIPLLAAAIGALSVAGLWQRIREYR
jgi:hypothetical protein